MNNLFLNQNQSVIFLTKQHPISYILQFKKIVLYFLLFLLLTIFFLKINFTISNKFFWLGILLSGGLLFFNTWFIVILINHQLNTLLLTDRFLICVQKIGFLNHRFIEFDLAKRITVSAKMRGYCQTIFQFGDLIIKDDINNEPLIVRNIIKPHFVAQKILKDNYRFLKSIHKLSPIQNQFHNVYSHKNIKDRFEIQISEGELIDGQDISIN